MSLQDMTVEQQEVLEAHLERQLANDRLTSYEPYPKQIEWHNAGKTHRDKALISGNQVGQSTCLAFELAIHATGRCPPWWKGYPPYTLLATLSLQRRQYEEAITYSEKTVALAPNHSYALAALGRNLVYVGRPEEGLSLIQRAIRLSPFTNSVILRFEGLAYYSPERYEEAIAAFECPRELNPKSPLPLAWLALTYANLDRMEQACTAAQEVLKLDPGFRRRDL